MPRLVLSMIVKDAEATLARCLASARGVVDEIVIADTGSSDRSREIAAGHGAAVFQIPWENDFAKARNLCLERVNADWVLVLDADEALDPAAKDLLPPLLAHPTVMGYIVQIRNYLLELNCHLWDQKARPNTSAPEFAQQYPAYVQHENIRLFRRHPDIYFVGRVHETVGTRLLELGMKVGEANFLVHHLGFIADDRTLHRKWEFYRELGRHKLRDQPDDANAHFELGVEEFEHFRNYEEALKLFSRACELNPRLGVAWLFRGLVLARTGKHREAIESFKRAANTGGKAEAIHESLADSLYNLGDFESARRSYKRTLDILGASPQIESKLGLAEVRAGNTNEGIARLRRAIEQEPQTAELYDRLIAALTWLGRLPEAAEAAEGKLILASARPEDFLRAAALRAERQDWKLVIDLLNRGLSLFPESARLRGALAEADRLSITAETEGKGDEQYQAGNFEAARRYYLDAIKRLGDLPHLISKLGLAEVRMGRVQQGLARLREALEKDSQSGELYDRLMGACLLAGRVAEAADVAERKLLQVGPNPDSYLRAASLRAQLQQWPQVLNLLREGLGHFPDSARLKTALDEVQAHVLPMPRILALPSTHSNATDEHN